MADPQSYDAEEEHFQELFDRYVPLLVDKPKESRKEILQEAGLSESEATKFLERYRRGPHYQKSFGSNTLQEAIESLSTRSPLRDFRRLDARLEKIEGMTAAHIQMTSESSRPREFLAGWGSSVDYWPDDQEVEHFQPPFGPLGRLFALGTPTRTLFAVYIASLWREDFTLAWLLEQQQYALIHDRAPSIEDSPEWFELSDRCTNLPSTTTPCSVAYLSGDFFKDEAKVERVEADGFVTGVVKRTSDGMEAEFGRIGVEGRQPRLPPDYYS